MSRTTIDFRDQAARPAPPEGALDYTGHEQLAEEFRKALAGPADANCSMRPVQSPSGSTDTGANAETMRA
ncbi:hypothetical protein [Rhodanobacter hydrolyticus]|uniref:Uncharacterized protein n=1 Tax=Rhodanobacter hydrolyticus TaxID=2250595 RepID=A0ABW8J5U3_9GAMM